MADYEHDPRVTRVGDDDYRVGINGRDWRIFRDGNRWFSTAPPSDNPHMQGEYTFEHPSKETAFESIVGSRTTVVWPEGQ